MLDVGYLPRVYGASRPRRLLDAYVSDYLMQEIAAEGLARNLPAFSSFLEAAAIGDTETVNLSNIARECGVSSQTVKGYFGILEDTLLGHWLPAWRRRRKRRLIGAAKFYFADVGVVNRLVRSLRQGLRELGPPRARGPYGVLDAGGPDAALTHWRLPSGVEVDFIVGDMRLAVEAKAVPVVASHHLRGLRSLAREHDARRRVVVCLEPRPRRTDDGIDVLPAERFAAGLWSGDLL